MIFGKACLFRRKIKKRWRAEEEALGMSSAYSRAEKKRAVQYFLNKTVFFCFQQPWPGHT
jgi:hypothetical protein